jgi:hypothetical protein
MLMRLFALALMLLTPAQVFAMPCDASYRCVSPSGKYKIDIQRCRYDNRLGAISSLQIGGKAVTDAQLGAAFDGDVFGGFEIDLAQQGDVQRILSVEWVKKTGKGLIRDKTRDTNPAPYKTTFSEGIACKIQE